MFSNKCPFYTWIEQAESKEISDEIIIEVLQNEILKSLYGQESFRDCYFFNWVCGNCAVAKPP